MGKNGEENHKITRNLTEKRFKELCTFFKNKNLQEFSLVENDLKVTLKAANENQSTIMVKPPTLNSETIIDDPKTNTASVKDENETTDGNPVTAPISGTFYSSPSPDEPPYVKVGDSVKKGDKLCIIEAMKVINEIESPFTGQVKAINANNGEPIKQGATIIIIK